MEWLPELVCCNGKNWVQIVEEIYPIFARDFIDTKPTVDGMQVRLREAPLLDGKERTFWHFVSESFTDAQPRIPDLARCERIAWVRAIIDHATDRRLRRWEQNRNGDINLAIALPDFSYVVILGRRQAGETSYLLALTAYCVEKERRREKLRKEWQAFTHTPLWP